MRAAIPIKRMHLAVGLTLMIVLSSFGFLPFGALAQPGVWEDLFDDATKISQQNNVVVAGGDVTLDTVDWDWYRHGIILDVGPPGSSYQSSAYPEVLEGSDGTWRMWYTGTTVGSPTPRFIRYATSADGKNWDRRGIVIGANASIEDRVYAATVIEDGGLYKMWYVGDNNDPPYGARIFYATSPSGYVWTRQGMVMDVAFEGVYDTRGVVFPEVIKEGGVYKMWYAGYEGSNYRILYATSNDGIGWTSQGLAIDIGNPGDFDSGGVLEPTVTKDPLGTYHMWYTGSDALNFRILNATSPGGVSWTKQGLSMNLLPNTPEDAYLFAGTVLIDSNWITTSWYGCVDSSVNSRVCMATRARNGYVISEVIGPIAGYSWLEFFSNKTDVGPDLFVAYSVLDGATGNLLMGYPQILAPQFSIASIDSLTYPSIQVRADLWNLLNNLATTPVLHDYAVTWDDLMPPVFGGLVSAVDDGTDGDITLSWNPAWDPSPPISYNIYIATTSGGQNFFVPDYSTSLTTFRVSGLLNGTRYYFVVRAEDFWGFEDSNTV
ncbi:MAG: fibronectin type III domain-containing protein, partial [Candidatus Thorarchaeota archaeon]